MTFVHTDLKTYTHIYCKESSKIKKVSKCLIEWSMSAQRPFLHEHQNILHYYHNNYHWCSCSIWIGVATIDWRTHPHLSSQHNKNMITSHFDDYFPHCNHLQIAQLVCLLVDIHVDLMFRVILFMDGWVRWDNIGKNSSTNQTWNLGVIVLMVPTPVYEILFWCKECG